MLNYIRKEIRDVHATVWYVACVVTVGLVVVVGWDEYKDAHRAPPQPATTSIPAAPHG